ncbi:GPI-anchor transamidase-like [Chrysoperla carnea]|uniref:GPI-anchor transamidase-like n=1 Tax=Chrysoperla carnea TaxID=189513 RepID=UPI001D06261F|nr:GPI-anchor transamidase-like [Chrysoperla carnea]
MLYFKWIVVFFELIVVINSEGNISKSNHTNNWAVLVDSSAFWHNYRHSSNVLAIYQTVKRLGIPDSQIILMIADEMACNPRNSRPATVYAKKNQNVYGDDVEVDYRGYDVTVENFIRLLTGRLPPGTPRSKQLLTDEGSNILLYVTGHGGSGFFKFRHYDEMTNQELANALEQMWQKRRYNEIFFMIDTCQAATMYERFYSPNILCASSSLDGEDSLSHHVNSDIGVYVMDRFTYHAFDFLEKINLSSSKTMSELFKVCPKHLCISTVGTRTDLFQRDPNTVLVTDFFGSNNHYVEMLDTSYLNITFETNIRENNSKNEKTENDNVKYKYVEQFPSYVFNP